MASVILEIARKEALSYYSRRSIIVQNIILLFAFSIIPIEQVGSVLASGGHRISSLSSTLDVLLLIAAFYPIMVANGISVLAFPYEKDQKTIEHLLSLPLSDKEIFLGKALAAIITGWAGLALVYSIVFGFTFFVDGSSIVWDAPLVTPSLAVSIFVVAPMLVVLSTMALIAISSYISNTRESYIINIILMGVVIGVGNVRPAINVDPLLFDLGLATVLAILAFMAYVVGIKAFSREKLISRI